MKDSLSLLLILGAAGFAAYYLYSQTHVQNQPSAAAQAAMQAAQAASDASSALLTPLPPSTFVPSGPTDAQLGITSTGTSGLGALSFRVRGPGGWAA